MIQPLTRSSCLAYVTFISTLPISLARSPHITLTLSPPPSHKRRTQHGRISSFGPLHLITLYIVKMLKAVSAAPVPGCHQLTYYASSLNVDNDSRLAVGDFSNLVSSGFWCLMDGIQLLCALCFQGNPDQAASRVDPGFQNNNGYVRSIWSTYGLHTTCRVGQVHTIKISRHA